MFFVNSEGPDSVTGSEIARDTDNYNAVCCVGWGRQWVNLSLGENNNVSKKRKEREKE